MARVLNTFGFQFLSAFRFQVNESDHLPSLQGGSLYSILSNSGYLWVSRMSGGPCDGTGFTALPL